MYKNLYSYTWIKCDERLVPFFNDLYHKSLQRYNNTVAKESSLLEQKRDKEKIYEFINCTEKYLYGMIKLGYINSSNKKSMIDRFLSLSFASVLPKEYRTNGKFIYGHSISGEKGIEINPELNTRRTLLYVSHELGHFMHDEYNWEKQKSNIVEILRNDQTNILFNNKNVENIGEGFALLDEAIVQDVGENITSYFEKKERKEKAQKKWKVIFECFSNFDYYEEFQTISENFSEFINFSKKGSNDLLKDLSLASYDGSLSQIILNSCNTSEKKNDLVFLLKNMGIIKSTKYALQGSVGQKYDNINRVVESINKIFKKNKKRIIKIDNFLRYKWNSFPVVKYTLENINCSKNDKLFLEEYLIRGINLGIFNINNINKIIGEIINHCDNKEMNYNFNVESIYDLTNKIFSINNGELFSLKYKIDKLNKNNISVDLSSGQINNSLKNLNKYINNLITKKIYANTDRVTTNNDLESDLLYYFSLPLKGVGTKDTINDKNAVLNDLIKRRLNTDFYVEIRNEYCADIKGHEDLINDFYKILFIIDKYSKANDSEKLFCINEMKEYGYKDIDYRSYKPLNKR